MNKVTIREATEKWLGEFNDVPGSIFEKLIKVDEMVSCYDSDLFRMIASPRIVCLYCGARYEGDKSLDELNEEEAECVYCSHAERWEEGYPQYAFPCGWSTLFNPKSGLDEDWLRDNAEEVAELGIFVFESEDFGILLGVDGAGFDFYEAYWVPLYKLRGLHWHTVEEEKEVAV